LIFHICARADWEQALRAGSYSPASFSKERFVHFSLAHQVCKTANRIFRGRTDLVLLEVDPALVAAEVRMEDLYGEGEEFPHVYGPIPVTAVRDVHSFLPNSDGIFELPKTIRS